MNQQWLTILMSKGIELEQNLRNQLQTAKDGIKTQLESRGIKLNPADLAALIEEVAPNASNSALSYALDLLRPFSAGMGLRVSRLSDTQVEMVIPAKTRNMTESEWMHEGALTTAAMEAAKLLWMRHALMGVFDVQIVELKANFLKAEKTDCRVRLELSEQQRELALGQVRDTREGRSEMEVKVFDEQDQLVAEFMMTAKLTHTPALA